eukprot:3936638-Rhodomonas_salina.1
MMRVCYGLGETAEVFSLDTWNDMANEYVGDGEWGGSEILQALANLCDCVVVTHYGDHGENAVEVFSPMCDAETRRQLLEACGMRDSVLHCLKGEVVHLRLLRNHYDFLVPEDEHTKLYDPRTGNLWAQ